MDNKEWHTGYTLTLYCTACNDPKGSRDIAYEPTDDDKEKNEDIPSQATAGYTVAFHPSKYKEYKGKRIYLEILDEDGNIIGKHQPYILDFHGKKNIKIIDFYIGERKICECYKHPWSGKECRFKFIKKDE